MLNLTLADFKKYLKKAGVLLFLIIYGAAFYQIGQNKGLGHFLKIKKNSGQQQFEDRLNRPQPFAQTQSGSIIAASVKLCANTIFGFEIAYPKDWFSTYNTDEQKCTYFAPYSFVIPAKPDDSFVPVQIEVVKIEDWLGTVKFYENPNDFQNIVSIQSSQVDGHFVRKVKAVSTGRGNLPQGFEKLSFLVFDAKVPLVISYTQQNEKEKTDLYGKILEEMVNSLKYR